MRKDNPNFIIALLIVISLIFSMMTIYVFGAKKENPFNTSARSAALYIPELNRFVYSKDGDLRVPMASTTKIMTALVAIENSRPEDIVVIDESAVGTEGSSAYLKANERITMEELLYALLLQSANDAAVAIACSVAGDIQSFSQMMNDKAEELGLRNTHFVNPHGLDDNDHYTTANDLAIIASAALNNDYFRKICSTYKKTFSDEERCRTYINHNKLLRSYDGCIGVKTGYTKRSGRCLVGSAERDSLRLVSVTLNASNDWDDHKSMLNYGFENYERLNLADALDHLYKIPVIGGEKDNLIALNPDSAGIIIEKTDANVDEQVKLVRYAVAPIKQGDILGEIIFTLDGKRISSIPLVAAESIQIKEKESLIKRLINIFK